MATKCKKTSAKITSGLVKHVEKNYVSINDSYIFVDPGADRAQHQGEAEPSSA